jgi:uncharacterized Rossmann fold enzyme
MQIKDYEQKLLADFGLQNVADEEKARILNSLSERFNDLIMIALINNLNEEQKQRFLAAVKNPDQKSMEEKVEDIASEVPGLAQKIEQALAEEYEILKKTMSK